MIHFFGPDGAGKSTQVDILIESIKEFDPRVKKWWVRSPHTFAFVLWRLFVKIGFYRVVSNPLGFSFRLPAVDRSRVLQFFWALVEFFSVLPLILRTRFLVFRGYKLVAERYILDSVTTIAYFIDDMNFLRSRISRLLFRLIPRNTVFIFLDSNYDTIFRRRAPYLHVNDCDQKRRSYGSVPRSIVEPREFIDFQRNAYRILARSFDALTIDTSESSVEETSKAILEYLRLG